MKCYVHRDVDAIGVRSECGQGVCDACAVRIGGKLFCKADADRVFSSAKEREIAVEVERPLRVTLSSILFVIYGLIGIGLSFLFIIGGFVMGGLVSAGSYVGVFNPFGEFASLGAVLFGGILLLMGIAGIVCGWWLWRMQIWGAAIGIALLVIGMTLALIPSAAAASLVTGELTGVVWAGNVAMMVLLIFSWPILSKAETSVPV